MHDVAASHGRVFGTIFGKRIKVWFDVNSSGGNAVEFLLLILILGGLFLGSMVLGVVAFSRSSSLSWKVKMLSERIAKLEAGALNTDVMPKQRAVAAAAKPAEQPLTAIEPLVVQVSLPTAPRPIGGPQKQQASRLESQLASRWFVWIGAAAVALGGLLFVRYAAQHSLVPPFLRIVFGLVLGAVLVGAGEYLRRTKTAADTYIPAGLSSGGIVTAFGSIYATYALYGLLGPTSAFVGLGLVALAALALSLLQGPLIAAVGLIGSFITPALIASENPQALGLFIYLIVIVAACFALLRQRQWDWLGYLSLIGAFGWAALWVEEGFHQSDVVVIGLFAFAMAGISAFAVEGKFVLSAKAGNLLDFGKISRCLKFALVGGTLAMLLLAAQADKAEHGFIAMLFFALGVVAVSAFGWQREGQSFAAPIAAGLTWLVLGLGRPQFYGIEYPNETQTFVWTFVALVGFGLLGAAGYLRKTPDLIWAALAAVVPPAFLFGIYFLTPHIWKSEIWALVAFAIAAFQVLLATVKRNDELSPALLLAGAGVLALFGFDKLASDIWLTLSIAALAIVYAMGSRIFATRHIGLMAVLLATLAEVRLFLRHSGLGGNVDLPWGLHWPLYGYGLPAIGFWWASRILADDKFRRYRIGLEGLSLGLVITLVSLEIRAFIGGTHGFGHLTLLELGAHICAWMGAAYGLVYRQTLYSSIVSTWGARVLLGLSSAVLVLGCLIELNPLIDGTALEGGVVLNSLLLAYLVPCLLLGLIAQKLAQLGLEKLRIALGALALACLLVYATLEVKVFFEGALIKPDFASDAESYSISLCWLVMALAFFVVGLKWKRVSLRYGGVAVMALALLKTFGYDFWKLGGLWQIASVMGIGLSLVGVGWLYARFMRGQEA